MSKFTEVNEKIEKTVEEAKARITGNEVEAKGASEEIKDAE